MARNESSANVLTRHMKSRLTNSRCDLTSCGLTTQLTDSGSGIASTRGCHWPALTYFSLRPSRTQDKKMSKSFSTLQLEGSPTQSRISPSIQRILRLRDKEKANASLVCLGHAFIPEKVFKTRFAQFNSNRNPSTYVPVKNKLTDFCGSGL